MTADRDQNPEDAPPSEEELREAESLRAALEENGAHEGADLLRAVKSAAAPPPLDEAARERAVEQALAHFARKNRRTNVVYLAFGTSLVVAAAAAFVFWFGAAVPSQPNFARARSTQSLFTEQFEVSGGESARIDRIASARAADLRENHFARWGVRERGAR